MSDNNSLPDPAVLLDASMSSSSTLQTEDRSENHQKDSGEEELPENALECAICLQTCIHPVRLPCTHIFCFLCVKGVANHSKKCALCRSEIPVDFLFRPDLLNADEVMQTPCGFDGKYQWFYEGVRGWWQYDVRASAEIEDRFQQGEKIVEMLIAGFLYVVDMENMIQYRRNNPTRRRRIKRDLVNIPDKKGVAGLACRRKVPKRSGGDGGEKQDGQIVHPAASTSSGQSSNPQMVASTSGTVSATHQSNLPPMPIGDQAAAAVASLSLTEAHGTSHSERDNGGEAERQVVDGLSDSD